jgi:hypothetical protein
MGRSRPAVLTLAGVLALAAVVAGCSRPPRSAETDRIATVVADAISYPRQSSAAGFARAALATRAGRSGRLRLVAMEELPADDPRTRWPGWYSSSAWRGPKAGSCRIRR